MAVKPRSINDAVTRRYFLGVCGVVTGGIFLSPSVASPAEKPKTAADWVKMRTDPVRGQLAGTPNLDTVLSLFPRTQGEPAFDPAIIKKNIAGLETTPPIDTGHAFLDLSVKTGLAHIDATFKGDHPKYGVGTYAEDRHDGFPPTIIATIDALSAWGANSQAAGLWRYWLNRFVRTDGTIDYYGPSISEYGQLLRTAALLEERAGPNGWWDEGFGALDRIAEHLLGLWTRAREEDGLISGSPEADTRKDVGKYFHNNAWVVKGLRRWADLCERRRANPTSSVAAVREAAMTLARDTLSAIRRTWPADPADFWLPPQVATSQRPERLTGTREASYTNYRYYPELLSSDLLLPNMANRIVESRLTAGDQFCGMTRFANHLDDWPLDDYLYGLWPLGRKDDFLLSLYGHIAYHQAEGHLTAYEQVSFPPGRRVADYCLPSQLVAARTARILV